MLNYEQNVKVRESQKFFQKTIDFPEIRDIIVTVSTRGNRVLIPKTHSGAVVNIELSKRKLAVLSAIVKSYIETGEPVGSKNLTALLENAPSSATLRNEMNALCALGFLSQPHTSAGRIPTSSGYRLYVNSLMHPAELIDSTKEYINSSLSDVGFDAQGIPTAVAEALCTLTGYPALSCYIVDSDVFLKQVKLLPVSRKTAVLLLIFSDGRTKSCVCNVPQGITAQMTESFTTLVRTKLIKKPLGELSRAYLQNVIASAGIDALSLTPLLTTLFDTVSAAAESSVSLAGGSNLYNFCSEREARGILSLTERTTPMLGVLRSSDKETDVIFGNDTDFEELKAKVMVVSKYYCKDKYCGKIGIIGPDRMSYEQIIPSIQYIANKLTSLLTDAVSDMED